MFHVQNGGPMPVLPVPVSHPSATISGVPTGGWGVQTPLPEIPKALQNRAKLNPIVKNVKNC